MFRNTVDSGMGGIVFNHGYCAMAMARVRTMRNAYMCYFACNCSSVDAPLSDSLHSFCAREPASMFLWIITFGLNRIPRCRVYRILLSARAPNIPCLISPLFGLTLLVNQPNHLYRYHSYTLDLELVRGVANGISNGAIYMLQETCTKVFDQLKLVSIVRG